MKPITERHLRGLMARQPRSVLLRLQDGELVFADPNGAYELCLQGAEWVITRTDLMDAGVGRRSDGSLAPGSLPLLRRALEGLAEQGYPTNAPACTARV